ncbi:hypothetical protein GW17_00011388 [Ensete ventricosum]|nr:hypothetical protein GW17_00011388 [Ensete ventricosum]
MTHQRGPAPAIPIFLWFGFIKLELKRNHLGSLHLEEDLVKMEKGRKTSINLKTEGWQIAGGTLCNSKLCAAAAANLVDAFRGLREDVAVW